MPLHEAFKFPLEGESTRVKQSSMDSYSMYAYPSLLDKCLLEQRPRGNRKPEIYGDVDKYSLVNYFPFLTYLPPNSKDHNSVKKGPYSTLNMEKIQIPTQTSTLPELPSHPLRWSIHHCPNRHCINFLGLLL